MENFYAYICLHFYKLNYYYTEYNNNYLRMYTHVQLKTNVHCWEMFVNKRNYWLTWKYSTSLNILYCLINIKLDTELWQIDNILHIDFVHVYNIIPQLITVYIYHKHERPWFFPRLLIVTTLIKSIKKCQQTWHWIMTNW
jgi:hypothetical protein